MQVEEVHQLAQYLYSCENIARPVPVRYQIAIAAPLIFNSSAHLISHILITQIMTVRKTAFFLFYFAIRAKRNRKEVI